MSQQENKYSLWATPNDQTREKLQALIDKLAEQQDSSSFVPHITLVGNIFASPDNLPKEKEKIEKLSKNIHKFKVTLFEYGYLNEEFRSLFLIARSDQLSNVYTEAAKLFPQMRKEPFQELPHLSVLYGKYDQAIKSNIIAANPLNIIEIEVESFDLYLTNNSVPTWQLEEQFLLAI